MNGKSGVRVFFGILWCLNNRLKTTWETNNTLIDLTNKDAAELQTWKQQSIIQNRVQHGSISKLRPLEKRKKRPKEKTLKMLIRLIIFLSRHFFNFRSSISWATFLMFRDYFLPSLPRIYNYRNQLVKLVWRDK